MPQAKLTRTKAESTRMKVPERPIPALQCITGGPHTLELGVSEDPSADGITPDCRTA